MNSQRCAVSKSGANFGRPEAGLLAGHPDYSVARNSDSGCGGPIQHLDLTTKGGLLEKPTQYSGNPGSQVRAVWCQSRRIIGLGSLALVTNRLWKVESTDVVPEETVWNDNDHRVILVESTTLPAGRDTVAKERVDILVLRRKMGMYGDVDFRRGR